MTASVTAIIGLADWLPKTINYEIIKGNTIWRFGLVLLVVLVAMAAGRIVQFTINNYAKRLAEKKGEAPLTLLLKAMANPVYVAIFAAGIFLAKVPLFFDDENGIRTAISTGWTTIARVTLAIAAAYGLYRLVDVIEYYLNRLVVKTETKLDDMLVPIVRKALRITIAIIAILLISENILGADKIKSLLFSAGIGGIAVALAAKDTIANFFGSITIFTDRPFQMGDLVKIGEHLGPVEEVGFRSTRIRTLQGHLVTIPNSVITNSCVENIGRRPFIRRTSNITITYDSGHTKAEKAVEIIKKVLADVPQLNTDPERPPRVYFSDFNDWSLNIYMSYWVKPPDYWLYHQVNEQVNFEIMKRFEAEQIEFAFPTQTLYVKKE
ncbi:MAG: mechanosensitive ion channel family protein [Planctomycetes bacterium]|nr:mechanosensitive ion channel family protein [Planctomycetota bacterium]MCH8118941.1 mechanosensitive ion channel family protein [Planctomycetota bacterium]